jgi:AcrR family transcriptional regulator
MRRLHIVEALGNKRSDALKGTKKQIVDVARRLFSDRSYLGVSMSAIAARLGITKASLYHHFSGNTDIYRTVLDDVLAELRARLHGAENEETPDGRLHQIVKEYLEFGMREKNLVNAFVVKLSPGETELRRHVALFREELVGLLQPVIEEIVAYRRLHVGVDGHLVTVMLTAMMDGLILEHSFLEKPLDPDKVSDQIVAVLGLRSEPSPSL